MPGNITFIFSKSYKRGRTRGFLKEELVVPILIQNAQKDSLKMELIIPIIQNLKFLSDFSGKNGIMENWNDGILIVTFL